MVGPLGGAASSAKVLGLDSHQTLMALGIAASRTGGLTANTGTMVKSTHPGNAARMGAEAAILAQMGYTSSEVVLEAPNGYAAALFQGQLDWDVLTRGLGESYRLVNPGFDIKRFPAQVYMQNPIEAVLNLRQRNALEPDMVEQLTIYRQGRGHSGPVPQSGLDGKFSVEYCAAVALLDGRVVIDSFTDQRRFSADMEAMLPKSHEEPAEHKPGVVTVTAQLKDGRTVSDECSSFTGSAANPMSREERMAKVWDCVGRALSTSDASRAIALLEDLEHVPDISAIMQIIGQSRTETGS
jgi:2-methylcitrate dehydratase PrpD